MKEVSKMSDDGRLSVIRNRTSNGYSSITIRMRKSAKLLEDGKEPMWSSFKFTNEDNDKYEMDVRELADMMQDVADNACQLPE